jgi:hypothetical protein
MLEKGDRLFFHNVKGYTMNIYDEYILDFPEDKEVRISGKRQNKGFFL